MTKNNTPSSSHANVYASHDRCIGRALAYDDILLYPSYSDILPSETNITTRLTRRIALNIPIVSAAMDTVTDSSMAVAIALEGGLGIIHKNMSIEQQVIEVRKVKRSQSGMILDPLYLYEDAKVQEAFDIMQSHKIGGIPIIDKKHKVIGILTNRDLRSLKDYNIPIQQVMTPNPITISLETTQQEAEEILQKHKIEKLPVVNEQGILKGLITYKDAQKRKYSPNACKDEFGRLRVGAALGVTVDTMERAEALLEVGVDVLSIDTAHAHSKLVLDMVKKLKKTFPDTEIIAGNIATAEAAVALQQAGVDAVKVGIGPGSICTTRIISGVGVPQFSAVLAVAEALKNTDIPLIADGGIRFSGDITKSVVAGADCVMIGSLLAGTEEAPGETILLQGKKYKVYRGMGSLEAMQMGASDRYFQDNQDAKKLVPEGVVGRMPYQGHAAEVIHQLKGGLQAGMGYLGCKDVTDLKKARFVEITPSGMKESHPHNIIITQDAPNYSYK